MIYDVEGEGSQIPCKLIFFHSQFHVTNNKIKFNAIFNQKNS